MCAGVSEMRSITEARASCRRKHGMDAIPGLGRNSKMKNESSFSWRNEPYRVQTQSWLSRLAVQDYVRTPGSRLVQFYKLSLYCTNRVSFDKNSVDSHGDKRIAVIILDNSD